MNDDDEVPPCGLRGLAALAAGAVHGLAVDPLMLVFGPALDRLAALRRRG